MSSGKKYRKGDTKHGDKNGTKKRTNRKFSCKQKPKHHECNGVWTIFEDPSRKCGYEWRVRWAPCREEEAIQFMEKEHGHIFNPRPRNKSKPRPVTVYSRKKHPKMHKFFFYSDPMPSQNHEPAKVASGKHHTRAPAADRHQNRNQHQQAQPDRVSDEHAAMLLHMLQQDSGAQPVTDPRVEAWVAKHPAPDMVMPPDQRRVPHEGMTPNPGMTFDQNMAPPQGMAGAQHMASAPVMPLPQEAIPDGQQHGCRRRKSRREPEPGSGQDPQPRPMMPPGPSMPAGMVSPTGMAGPPGMPPAQGPHGGRRRGHSRGPSGQSNFEQTPMSPVDMPPPRTFSECMAIMEEEAMAARLEDCQVNGDVLPAGAPPMPPPMNPMMPAYPSRNMPMRQGPQQAPGMPPTPPTPGTSMPPLTMPVTSAQNMALRPAGQAVLGMSGPPDMQLPMGPSGPPPQNMTLRQPRPQPRNPGILSRAPGAAGTPGAQAMAMGPPPGALSTTPGMPRDARMKPPPMSMPPFPGTGPGTPASLDLAMAPPPPVPTPPYLG